MFCFKTAWFSSSVPQHHLDFWRQECGSITGWREADYLFSTDATCPDTLRIFESKDYIWNKVTVIHSLFLSTCEKRQSVKSLGIGHYVLPPACVQDEVRKVVGRFIWEHKDEETDAQLERPGFPHALQDVQQSSSLSEVEHSEEQEIGSLKYEASDSSESETVLWDRLRSPGSCTIPVYVSIEKLPKYSGDLCFVNPELFQCSKCKGYIFFQKKE
ncbi:telomere repeats-binding bouquet formation protein 2 [Cyprinodon tularosa]|uniref:telomere repeats-binding bouquet formation protein 2 n=1 Tax=Cyprinodon tularosa TaxID=77115 RepID=UPI0018E27BAC|nr:telomere repeats-binding bouquet formation protein 2 [Cyprinodon tularosa]